MRYVNPGQLYVETRGPPQDIDDVMGYVKFLMSEAGLSIDPPVDLTRIYSRFGIPIPRRADLHGQQGLLVNPESGLIVINENDYATRQRFTEAHELIELLFSQLPSGGSWAARQHGPFKSTTKEALCNRGAAELLMPSATFQPRILEWGMSLDTARLVALEYEVSTLAGLVNMARIGPGSHAVVVWRYKHKPTELRAMASGDQMALFGAPSNTTPTKRLRVEWAMGKDGGPFIPPNKSVPEGSAPHEAWATGEDTTGRGILMLGKIAGETLSENHPFEADAERMVVSLLHLPGDENCRPHSASRRVQH